MKYLLPPLVLLLMSCSDNSVFTTLSGSVYSLNQEMFIDGVRRDCQENSAPSYCNSEAELQIWLEYMFQSMDMRFSFDTVEKSVKIKLPLFEEELRKEYQINGDTVSIPIDPEMTMDLLFNREDNSLSVLEMATPIVFSPVKE